MQRLGACANSLIVKMICISCALQQPARAQKAAVDCVPSDYLPCIPAIVRIRARSRCLHLCAPLTHAALLPFADLSPAKVNSMDAYPLWANIDVIVRTCCNPFSCPFSNPCCNRLQVHSRPPQVAAAGTAFAAAAAALATAGAAIATIIAIAEVKRQAEWGVREIVKRQIGCRGALSGVTVSIDTVSQSHILRY